MEKNKTPKKQINNKLRQTRLKKLWTLQKAADAVKVSYSTFIRWEKNIQQPSLVNLESLCQTFNKTEEELGYGHLTTSDDASSQIPPNGDNVTDLLTRDAIIPTPTPSVESVEPSHQRLVALAVELFPNEFPPRVNRFQTTQNTLHVFCHPQLGKSVTASIKTEFRRRSGGWHLGIERKS